MSLQNLPKDRAQGMEINALNRRNLETRISRKVIVDIDMQQDDTASTSTNNIMDDPSKPSKQPQIGQTSGNVTQNVDVSGRGSSVSGEWQDKSANFNQIQVCSSSKARTCSVTTSSSAKDILLNSKMSPGDIYDPPSSFSPTSSGTTSSSDTASTSSSPPLSVPNSLSPLPSPALPLSKESPLATSHHDLQVNIHFANPLSPAVHSKNAPTQSSDNTKVRASPDTGLVPEPPKPADATTTASSLQRSNSSQGQVTPLLTQRGSERKAIFVPNFFSSIRPSSFQEATPASHQTQLENRSQYRIVSSISSQSSETARPHIIVTDVRSINFRDISTVPTLTTFGHRRSKRRNSSLSYPNSPGPSTPSSNNGSSTSSSSSSTLLPTLPRRKRIKKSSHSTTSRSHRTASRDCSESHNSASSASTSTSAELLSDLEHKEHRSSGSQIMGPSGRIRTMSESEVIVTDCDQLSRRLLHQRQQRRSRQSSSHQQGQEQDAEQGRTSMQDTIPSHHSLHIQHHHQQLQAPSAPQHPLQDTQHCSQENAQERQTSSSQRQLRIQHRQERDLHHKRQRSPPAQITTFDPSITSSSSLTINNTERLKRAKHRNLAAVDEDTCIADGQQEYTGNNEQKSWRDSTEQRNKTLSLASPNHIDDRQTNVNLQIQQQQPARIHPFDNEPATIDTTEGKSCESRSTPESMPIIPKTPEKVSRSKSSIHPLDADEFQEVAGDTKSVTGGLRSDQKVESVSVNMPAKNPSLSKQETIDQAQTLNPPKTQGSAPGAKDNSATVAQSSRSASSAQQSKPSSASLQAHNPATLMLPITRETLRELDMIEIFKNPQVRHDIVFDPHLQFRPNFDGERGHIKRREADRFWSGVKAELENRRNTLATRRETTATMLDLAGLSSSNPTSRLVHQQAQQMCPLPDAVLLPRLINELREILLSLLPQPPPAHQGAPPAVNPERALLISTLDPDLLIQELDHGVLDVHTLFRFLGDSLKGHCAPMRDPLVEAMVETAVDHDNIVRGIRMCFEILEWMKLDIANHQLRTLRPWLLDNSVDFERKYFIEHLARSGTIHRTKEWFKRSWIKWDSVKRSVIGQQQLPSSDNSKSDSRSSSLIRNTSPPSNGEQSGNESRLSPTVSSSSAKRRSSIIRADIGENIVDGVVNEGLLEMVLKPHSSVNTMPETFEFDHYRMLSFHNDFQDLTILCTLLILFRQLAQTCWTQQDLVEIKKVVWLLLTDENANFGANTNPGPGANAAAAAAGDAGKTHSHSGSSSGMKDIVLQIEFAARKVRERGKNAASASRRSSLALETLPAATQRNPHSLGDGGDSKEASSSSAAAPLSSLAVPSMVSSSASPAPVSSLSTSDTNLLTAWLDNALCKTSTLYMLIQKRLLIHFRRWLYFHSCSSMLALSASCATLASAIAMSSTSEGDLTKVPDEDDDDDKPSSVTVANNDGDPEKGLDRGNVDGNVSGAGSAASTPGAQSTPAVKPVTEPGVSTSELSPEEANKAAEALAAKFSFDATEMEAHGLTGLEDEMIALLEKIRAVSEFNKKVYGSWYRDMVKQGRAENWLEKTDVPK
ncbi:hypothetical protein BGX21_006414 [Mortierella sp. AD011]|nr:hypothetical protein BGX20_002292 [Mortierella sp. AD010]KAF9399351.1 hypothetical protein BGX21_006414 [Mortierella sp. AD011]